MSMPGGVPAAVTPAVSAAADAPGLAAGAPRRGRGPRRETLTGWAFIAPFVIGFVVFSAIPMGASLVLSLTDFDPRDPAGTAWVGLENYARMLSDPVLHQSIGVTLRFALLTVPLTLAVALGLAVLVNSRLLAARTTFRTLFYLPMHIPVVASTLVWMGVLHATTGWLNLGLGAVGVEGPNWLQSPFWVGPALALMSLWGIGNMMLIFLAGLQAIPSELHEAATVDGAGPVQRFRRITLPLLSPVLFYNLVIALIATFQFFTQAHIISNGRGDPDRATLFFNLNLYREAFAFFDMGYASALAWLLFVIVLGLTIVLFRTSRFWVYEAGTR